MSAWLPITRSDILKSAMAMSEKDFKTLQESHEDSGIEYIDPARHYNSHKPDPEYISGLMSKTMLPKGGPSGTERGVRPKVIHDIGNDTYMTKPYFPSTSRGISPLELPLGGWATLATKEMYQAAGLGSIVENVSMGLLKKIPTTVHKFSKAYKPVYTLHEEVSRLNSPIRRTPRPLELYQLGIMDFLTGNADRNSFNLLISDATNEDGHHDILAIDHEGAFQYGIKRLNSLPSYMKSNAISKAIEASYSVDFDKLIAWWREKSPYIKDAFKTNLSDLRNQPLSEYLEKKFEERFSVINEALSDINRASKAFNDPSLTKITPERFKLKRESNKRIDAALPQDPVSSVLTICSIYHLQKPKGKIALFASFEKAVSRMSQQQFLKIYRKSLSDPNIKINDMSLTSALNFYIIRHNRDDFAKTLLQFEKNISPGILTPVLKKQFLEL